MPLVNRSLRLVTVMAVAAAAVMSVAASSASAATAAPARTAAHAATTHEVTAPVMTSKKTKVPKILQPSGCNNNNFCEYNAGNGGNLCFQSSVNQAVWPTGCRNQNEGEYNRNGNATYMHEQENYQGCYYLLYSGHYLLYNEKDMFQGGGSGCTGIELEHNLASNIFVS